MSDTHNTTSGASNRASGSSSAQPKKSICIGCGKSLNRPQDLERHYKSLHLPSWIFCPHSHCQWRGDRTDEFQRHLGQEKCGGQPAEEKEYQIYDVYMVLSWIKNSQGKDILSTVQTFAVDVVKERALELGKHEWLEDPWGRSHKQARYGQHAELSM